MKRNVVVSPRQLALHEEFLERQLQAAEFEIDGIKLSAPPGVYHPDEQSSTRLLLAAVPSRPMGCRVLDLGTGTGALGLSFALPELGNDVVLVDVTEAAVETAAANARANGLVARVVRADLFDHPVVAGRYDVIFFNTPLWHVPLERPEQIVSNDPDGALFLRFLDGLPQHLGREGRAYVTYSNYCVWSIEAEAARRGLRATMLRQRADGDFVVTIWELVHAGTA